MSTFFFKNRQKRPRSPSSEESDPSFVQNVTSRVSWLLPNMITKWFNSPKSSNANGSGPTTDATDSSTEDETQENATIAEPQAKRMRFRSPTRVNYLGSTSDAINTVSNADTIEANTPCFTVHSPPGRTTFRRETNFVSTPLRSPNEESTIEHTQRDTDTTFKSPNLTYSPRSSVATKRKSIFGNDFSESSDSKIKALAKSTSNTMVDPNQPRFKPSLLALPFYPARTTYGGASSAYMNQPNIKQRINIAVNKTSSSDDTSTMSYTARRVLDILEHYSSPLIDAKRIAPYITRSSKATPNSTLNSSSSTTKKVLSPYKTQELHVPSLATILRIKQKSRIMDSTNVARQIIASHSSTKEFTPYQPVNTQREETTASSNANIKQTMKVKSRITRSNRRENANMESDILEPLNLPSAVLHVDNLQTLSFGNPINSNTSTSISEKPVFSLATSSPSIVSSESTTTKISEVRKSKPVTVSNDSLYKFSSPIRISTDSSQNIQQPKFTFGSPDRSIHKVKVNEQTDCKKTYIVSTQEQNETLSTTNFKDPSVEKVPDTFFNFGIKNSTKDSEKFDKCSVCKLVDRQSHVDKCINCENRQLKNASSVPVTTSTASSKWKCDDCWVTNDETVDKCVCCGAKNPKKSNVPVVNVTVSNVTSKNIDWKCEDCWIKNKSSVDKCAACGGAKPGAKQSTIVASTNATLTFKPPDDSLKNIIQTQTDRWECPCCLVRNENDKTICICCETKKPGSTVTEPENKFNFGTTSNTTFKFGIDFKAQEVNLAKQTEAELSSDNKSNVETNNNVLPKTVTFAFSSPANKDVESKADTTKENVSETPNVNFTFGIPKDAPGTQSITPILKNTVKKVSESTETITEDKEKRQEVPKVDLIAPATTSASEPMSGLFGSPVISQNLSDKQTPTPILFTSSIDNKETPSQTLQTATTSEESHPKNTFTFTSGAIKPAVNLFGSPSSTTTSTSVSFVSSAISTPATTVSSLFQKHEIAPTSAVPLFQNNEPTTTSTVPLFQKNDTPITTTASLAAPSSIFSFGTNTQNAQQTQQEKPKFNFVFGSNNKETTPLFKSTFSATANKPDSSPGNKFILSTGNTLGTSKTLLNTSSIGGGNGLPGNSIMGNALGGNGLPSSNALASGSTRPVNTLATSTGIATGTGFQPGSTLSPTPSNGLFGSPAQKENVWSSTNNSSSNLFVSNATTNTVQKPATFAFGSSTPFNSNNSTPVFGNNAQPSSNLFGMTNQNMNSQPSMFSSPVQSQPAPIMFGSPQPASNPAPSMGMFGTPSVGATPTFGTPNPSIPTFEAPSLTPAQAPAFNFGAPQVTGVFGFGQQPPQQSAGVYNFGASGGTPQVQFNMGSAPNTLGGRRVRKAVRRNPQR